MNWKNWKSPTSQITKLGEKSTTVAVNNEHGSACLQMRAVLKWKVKQSKGSRRSLDDEDGGGIEVALVYYRI